MGMMRGAEQDGSMPSHSSLPSYLSGTIVRPVPTARPRPFSPNAARDGQPLARHRLDGGARQPGRGQLEADLRGREPRAAESCVLRQRGGPRVLYVARGPVDLGALVPVDGDWLGLLITGGLLAVTLEAGRAHSSWVFGQEDLVRPWDMRDLALTKNVRWRCLTPAQIALLDGDFSRRVAGLPAVTHKLVEHAAETSRWLLARSIIGGAARAEDRLVLLFRLLAERWGKVGPEGVRLPLPITHALLAQMCGVRRPTVTLALRAFRDQGLIDPLGRDGWLLRGDPSAWELRADWD